jgi:hypothetical protein
MESARTSGTLNGVTTQKTLNLHRRENLSCRIAMYLFFSAFTCRPSVCGFIYGICNIMNMQQKLGIFISDF